MIDNVMVFRAVRPGDDISFCDGKMNAVVLEVE